MNEESIYPVEGTLPTQVRIEFIESFIRKFGCGISQDEKVYSSLLDIESDSRTLTLEAGPVVSICYLPPSERSI